jgi:hypothetical protein
MRRTTGPVGDNSCPLVHGEAAGNCSCDRAPRCRRAAAAGQRRERAVVFEARDGAVFDTAQPASLVKPVT